MTGIKIGDFVELKYEGKVEDEVFDTTEQIKEKSIVVCVGQGHVLKGLDSSLEGREVGKEFHTLIRPEDGFGRKDARLIQMIPKSKFTSQKITPQMGMQLNIDNRMAIVRQVSGGRVLVDFNHPLAGRELSYKATPLKIITDKKEQLKQLLKIELGLPEEQIKFTIKDDSVSLEFPEALKAMIKYVEDKLKEKIISTTNLKDVKIDYKEIKKEEKEKKTVKEGKEDKKTVSKGATEIKEK